MDDAAKVLAPATWQRVTTYVVSAIPEGLFEGTWNWDVTVAWRGGDRWAVLWGGHYCLSDRKKPKWDFEPQPSSRTDSWRRHHYFTEEDALRRAHEVAPTIRVNGATPADLIRKYSTPEEVS